MDANEKLQWSALEYEDKERSSDWFWAFGIIVVTSSIAAIIFGDYFLTALIILSAVLLAFFAKKKPDMISYELNNRGLKIGNNLYLYESMKSFWIQTGVKPLLFIHSERAFMPIITIPIEEEMAQEIHSVLASKDVALKEMKEHPSERIMEFLGF